MWLYLTSLVYAATWNVPSDAPTIAGAVALAINGDTITIDAGQYTDSVELINTDLTFEGQQGTEWITPDNAGDALICRQGADCTVRGITFDGNGGRAIQVIDAASSLIVEDCYFSGGVATDGGAILATYAEFVVILDSRFEGNTATASGGHVRVTGVDRLEVRDSVFLDGSAAIDAGAIRASGTGIVELYDLWIQGNESGDDGGGIDVSGGNSFEMYRSVLCDNTSPDDGGGLVVRSAASTLVGNVLLNNSGARGGGMFGPENALVTRNNHFVGNSASISGSGVVAVAMSSTNDLFAHNHDSVAHDDSAAGLSHDAFWSNPDGDSALASLPSDTVTADPLLGASPPATCDLSLLVPRFGSALIDAGDPGYLDPDGGPSDIGAFGGPDPYVIVVDDDGDGFDVRLDCDDGDPSISPAAAELICDGLDNDCDPSTLDDPDADGDGYLACQGDCDDSASDVFPGQLEVTCDGLDNDCDPSTSDGFDGDGDGYAGCGGDCDDDDPAVFPGAREVRGDGLDNDCDTYEACYPDTDGDGYGEPGVVLSEDLDCSDPGEASAGGDRCVGYDDDIDTDSDGIPDGCDEPESGPDSDGDGLPDSIDPDPRDPGGDGKLAAPKPSYGCGCRSPAPLSTGWWLGGLGLLGLRRRRRAR